MSKWPFLCPRTLVPFLYRILRIHPDTLSFVFSTYLHFHNLLTQEDLVSYYNSSLNNILNSVATLKTKSVSFPQSAPCWESLQLNSGFWKQKADGLNASIIRKLVLLFIRKCLIIMFCIIKSVLIKQNLLITPPWSVQMMIQPRHRFHCSTLLSGHQIFLPAHPRPGLFHVALPLQFHSHHTVFLLSSFPLSLIFQISSVSQNLGKACLTSLLPLISAIIYSSLTTGTVPASFKFPAITPILKIKQNTKKSKTKQNKV